MALNIRLYIRLMMFLFVFEGFESSALSAETALTTESIEACVIPPQTPLTQATRALIARCLGWESDVLVGLCQGAYHDELQFSARPGIVLEADQVHFQMDGPSRLEGHIELKTQDRRLTAKTATVYRRQDTHQIDRIVLHDNVHWVEQDKNIWADEVEAEPQKKSGVMHGLMYRLSGMHRGAVLPAWGLAQWAKRFENQSLWFHRATYSTCPPARRDWMIEAKDIHIDPVKGEGDARHAVLRMHDIPIFYAPYLAFPTTKKRKSGFLMPLYGYSNVGGFDVAFPYYWNILPQYDATLTPHAYTFRGLMLGAETRFLTTHSLGMLQLNLLPDDQAYRQSNPSAGTYNRWAVLFKDDASFSERWGMHVNVQQVSDDYYLQDFSSNLAIATDNQLKKEARITYTTEHWQLQGLAEAYQTLNPLNDATVNHIYGRLPQLWARGDYDSLPLGGRLRLIGQFDQFQWPVDPIGMPEGPRFHLHPQLSWSPHTDWGYITPEVQWIENDYYLRAVETFPTQHYQWGIPRYSVDTGLFLEDDQTWSRQGYTQTLEPRLFYLNVPYFNQSTVPAFDAAYMIFTADQLFRMNRFSGQDRIGDTHQLSYALTMRWIAQRHGRERARLTVGQTSYFSERKVQLCYAYDGLCEDSPQTLGYLPKTARVSPIATQGSYDWNTHWRTTADWVFDPTQLATNNADFNFHYEPKKNHIVRVGYSYLVNGNVFGGRGLEMGEGALHQGTLGYAWPLTPHWSGLGVYSYNLSEHYDMMTFLGFQYDSCCWAVRFLGGRVFNRLSTMTLKPHYNQNMYVQILLKGLGSVGHSDPASVIQSYLPGYTNQFQY